MATFNATDLFSKNIHGSQEANEGAYHGSLTPTAGAAADVYRLCEIPGGTEVYRVTIKNGDLDTNAGPTLAVKIGFKHKDGSTGDDDDAFAAAGSTILQSASPVGGNVFFVKPVAIEKDSYLVMTVTTAAATFAAAEITGVVESIGRGKK